MPCNCPSCRRDNILNGTLVEKCACCQTEINAKITFKVMGDGSLVCESCYKEHYDNCIYCNKPFKKTELKNVVKDEQPAKICKRCFDSYYRECLECHTFVDRHECIQSPNDGKILCKPCFNKSYQQCHRCQSMGPKDSFPIHWLAGGLRGLCDNCYNQFGPITEYSSKPKIVFYGISHLKDKAFEDALKRTHFYGVELEVELKNRDLHMRGAKADQVLQLLGSDFAITKEDGSVKYGFEICTAPATLGEHYTRWKRFFEKLPDGLVSWNAYQEKCGLHIHCSKKPLSLLTIAKMVVFANSEPNQKFIESIAGRGSNQYFKIQKKNYNVVIPMRDRRLTHDDRYEAINLVNRDTIEFRIFRGTLREPSFFKALEFCDALTHFCMAGSNSISYCRSVDNFIDYVGLRAKDYPHLYAFICAKVLKKETKLTKQFGFGVSGSPTPDGQL